MLASSCWLSIVPRPSSSRQVSVCCGGLAVILLLLVLGHSYWYLVAFFRCWEDFSGGFFFSIPPSGPDQVTSWGPLWPLLERSWALLGLSWFALGICFRSWRLPRGLLQSSCRGRGAQEGPKALPEASGVDFWRHVGSRNGAFVCCFSSFRGMRFFACIWTVVCSTFFLFEGCSRSARKRRTRRLYRRNQ